MNQLLGLVVPLAPARSAIGVAARAAAANGTAKISAGGCYLLIDRARRRIDSGMVGSTWR
jgi:hypothetical protein